METGLRNKRYLIVTSVYSLLFGISLNFSFLKLMHYPSIVKEKIETVSKSKVYLFHLTYNLRWKTNRKSFEFAWDMGNEVNFFRNKNWHIYFSCYTYTLYHLASALLAYWALFPRRDVVFHFYRFIKKTDALEIQYNHISTVSSQPTISFGSFWD